MLIIMGALKEEIKDLRNHMVLDKTSSWNDCHFYQGSYKNKDVVLVQTGIGKNQAEEATRFALDHYPVTALISLGFAGALTEHLKIGDIVICVTLCCAGEHEAIPTPSKSKYYNSDDSLIALAKQTIQSQTTRFYQGSSVTVAKPASTQEEKQALFNAFSADVVEMENYWIAQIAFARQIPFIAIRAISDTLRDSLPIDFIDSHGAIQWKLAIPRLATHPQNLIKLFNLSRNAGQARKNMTIFIDRFVDNL